LLGLLCEKRTLCFAPSTGYLLVVFFYPDHPPDNNPHFFPHDFSATPPHFFTAFFALLLRCAFFDMNICFLFAIYECRTWLSFPISAKTPLSPTHPPPAHRFLSFPTPIKPGTIFFFARALIFPPFCPPQSPSPAFLVFLPTVAFVSVSPPLCFVPSPSQEGQR